MPKVNNQTNYCTADLQKMVDLFIGVSVPYSNTLDVKYFRLSKEYKEIHQTRMSLKLLPYVKFTNSSTKHQHSLYLLDVRKLPDLMSPMEGLAAMDSGQAPRDMVRSVAMRLAIIRRNVSFRYSRNWDEWPSSKSIHILDANWSDDLCLRFTPGKLDEAKIQAEKHQMVMLDRRSRLVREVELAEAEVKRSESATRQHKRWIEEQEKRMPSLVEKVEIARRELVAQEWLMQEQGIQWQQGEVQT